MILRTPGFIIKVNSNSSFDTVKLVTPWGKLTCYSKELRKVRSKQKILFKKLAFVNAKIYFRTDDNKELTRFPGVLIDIEEDNLVNSDLLATRLASLYDYIVSLVDVLSVLKSGEGFFYSLSEVVNLMHTFSKEDSLDKEAILVLVEAILLKGEGYIGRIKTCEDFEIKDYFLYLPRESEVLCLKCFYSEASSGRFENRNFISVGKKEAITIKEFLDAVVDHRYEEGYKIIKGQRILDLWNNVLIDLILYAIHEKVLAGLFQKRGNFLNKE